MSVKLGGFFWGSGLLDRIRGFVKGNDAVTGFCVRYELRLRPLRAIVTVPCSVEVPGVVKLRRNS
jgi:hypothetical protein